jgi:hypothetical protein
LCHEWSLTGKPRKQAAPRKRPTGTYRPNQPGKIDECETDEEDEEDFEDDEEEDERENELDEDSKDMERGALERKEYVVGESVRVWWPNEEDWFDGTVDKVMPASIEVFYPESNTYSAHRTLTTLIEMREK